MPQTPRDMIERLAQERFQGRMRGAFLRSLDKIKSELTLEEIARRIEQGDIEGAVRAVGLTPDNFGEMREATAASVAAGGAETGKFVPPRTGSGGDKIKFQFKPGNSRAEAAVDELHVEAMRGLRGGPAITEEGAKAIRAQIRAGIERGDNPRTTARRIRGRWNPQTKKFDGGILGLTDTQAGHVRNAEAQLRSGNKTELRKYLGRKLRDKRFDRTVLKAINEGTSLDEASIQKMVTGYERKYVQFRAETIARDQTLSALTRGQEEALDQAVEAGHTDNQSIRRFWQTAGDDRVRNAHQRIPGMNRGGVRRDQRFETPLGPLRFPRDPQGTPANTIQCRCSLAVRIDEPQQAAAETEDA